MQTHRHQADILIIGGGVCGLNAALTAREQGRSVIVMDKAVIERSGHIAGGIDHFLAYMNTGAEWDTREAYLEFTGKSARGVTNIDVVDSVYCQELPHALKRFEEINCTLRQPDGTYYRTKSYGQPGPWWINFNGKRMKPLLAKAARKAGCAVLDRVVTADLLTNGGTVCGAAGFDIRTGDFHIIRAGAVIISTGGTNRLYSNPSGMSFNTWMCPADTGDGIRMAQSVGAALRDMDQIQLLQTTQPGTGNCVYAYVAPKEAAGYLFFNKEGHRFIGEDGRRDEMSKAMIAQPDGLVYYIFSCEDPNQVYSLGKKTLQYYLDNHLYGYMIDTSIEGLAGQMGVPADALAQTVAEFNAHTKAGDKDEFGRVSWADTIEGPYYVAYQRKPAVHHTMGGVRIDTKTHALRADGTVIEGLYCAGEVVGGIHGGNRLGGNAIVDFCVFGRLAGQTAATE